MDSQPSTFSTWVRRHLKDAYSGLIAHDIDYAIYSRLSRSFYLLEEKRSSYARIGPAQAVTYKAISDLVSMYRTEGSDPRFMGCALIYTGGNVVRHVSEKETVEQFAKRLALGEFTPDESWMENTIARYKDRLWNCVGLPPIQYTQPERTFLRFPRLRLTYGNHLEVETIDWIILNYCTGLFLLLEENGLPQYPVRLLDSMLRVASDENQSKRFAINATSGAVYRYLGLFVLRYHTDEHSRPSEITLNGFPLDEQQLASMLNLDSVSCVERLQEYENG